MESTRTTAVVQRYLDELRGHSKDASAAPIVRELLEESARRLHFLCTLMLRRNYPRLARPPLNLQAEEMLGAVAERLIKALRECRPANVRAFFALANQHMRWELNDLARRLDQHAPPVEMGEDLVVVERASESGLTANTRRILAALDSLDQDEREVFGLIRIQGLTHAEAASVLGVSTKTVQRRLNRGRVLLVKLLQDLRPHDGAAGFPLNPGPLPTNTERLGGHP